MEGVVYLDCSDRKMVLVRQSGRAVSIEQCGIRPEKRLSILLPSTYHRYGYKTGTNGTRRCYCRKRYDFSRLRTRVVSYAGNWYWPDNRNLFIPEVITGSRRIWSIRLAIICLMYLLAFINPCEWRAYSLCN